MRGQRPYPAKINPTLPSKRDIHWCYFCNGCQIQNGGNAGSGSLQGQAHPPATTGLAVAAVASDRILF